MSLVLCPFTNLQSIVLVIHLWGELEASGNLGSWLQSRGLCDSLFYLLVILTSWSQRPCHHFHLSPHLAWSLFFFFFFKAKQRKTPSLAQPNNSAIIFLFWIWKNPSGTSQKDASARGGGGETFFFFFSCTCHLNNAGTEFHGLYLNIQGLWLKRSAAF